VTAGTIDIPKVGRVKRTYVYAGGAVVGTYVAYRYWSASRAPSTPDGTYQPELDTSSITDAGGGSLTSDRTGNTTDTSATDGLIMTNDQWTQKAVDVLTTVGGWEPRVVLTALGKFLARQALTDSEALIVQAAKAAVGNPPVGGPYNVIHVAGGNTTPAKPEVPKAPAGQGINTTHDDNVIAVWGAVSGATGYQVDWNPGGSHTLGNVTSYRITGLKPAHRYTFRVRARNAKGYGPWSPPLSFTTGKKGT